MSTPTRTYTGENRNVSNTGSRLPMPVTVPNFKWETDKWSTSRTLNVEVIAEQWRQTPHLVRVFTDRKFGNHSMVMLRKDAFESVVKTLNDIQHGDIMLKSNLEALFDQVRMVTVLFESGKVPATAEAEPISLAIKSLTRVAGQIQSTLHYVMPPKKVEPSPLTPEEEEELRRLG